MKKIFILLVFVLFLFVVPANSSELCTDCADICTVTKVIDGDTIKAECVFRGRSTIRLNTIDSFESRRFPRAYKQAKTYNITIDEVINRGKKAKKITSTLVLNKHVVLFFREHKYGRYGRMLADIFIVIDGKWTNLNNFLLIKHSDVFFKYGK